MTLYHLLCQPVPVSFVRVSTAAWKEPSSRSHLVGVVSLEQAPPEGVKPIVVP